MEKLTRDIVINIVPLDKCCLFLHLDKASLLCQVTVHIGVSLRHRLSCLICLVTRPMTCKKRDKLSVIWMMQTANTRILTSKTSKQLYNPSIHFLPLNPSVGSGGGAGAYPSSLRAIGGVLPWTGRQSFTGPHRDKRDKQPCMHTFTPKDNLESSINLTCNCIMFTSNGEWRFLVWGFQKNKLTQRIWCFMTFSFSSHA